MPISLVAGGIDAFGGTISSITFSNIAPVAGNLLVIVAAQQSGNEYDTVSGWNRIDTNAGALSVELFYKISDGTETGFSWTGKSGIEALKVFQFEGNAATDVLDASAFDSTNASAASQTCYSGEATATVSDAMALFAAVSRDQRFMEATTLSVNNSFTALHVVTNASLGLGTNYPGIEVWKRDITATGNYSCTETSTDAGDENIGVLAIFKAASGAPSGPPTLTGISASGITSSGATLTITAS